MPLLGRNQPPDMKSKTSKHNRANKKVLSINPAWEPVNVHAAGVDIGSREHWACVPTESSDRPVRKFGTFTADLEALADWFQACGITSVAMEATGVYWIPLFQILERRGFQVVLVNARQTKNVAGRKSDVQDCQWIQRLHTYGLLQGSFRPEDAYCVLRTHLRYRDELVCARGTQCQHMQKAMQQMNIQLTQVLSDVTGLSGLAIIGAILKGERDPVKLAALGDDRLKATKATLRKALTGDYRTEHLFCLRQSHAGYLFLTQQIAELEAEIEKRLAQMAPKPAAEPNADRPKAKAAVQRAGNAPALLERLFGVDLCTVPGFSAGTVHTLWAELGADLSAFPTAKHFCSWLSLCPDNRISGGKILSVATRHTSNRVAKALRLAAQALWRAKNELGEYYRRMRAKLGGAAAVTAVAHKLARIFFVMVKTKAPYDPTPHQTGSLVHRERTLARIRSKAKELGFQIVPIPQSAECVS